MSINAIKGGLVGSFIGSLAASSFYFKNNALKASMDYLACGRHLNLLKTIAKTMEPLPGTNIRLGLQTLVDAAVRGDRDFVRDMISLSENPSALDNRCQPLLEKIQDAEWQSTVATSLAVTAAVVGIGLIAYLKRPAKNA